MPNTKTRVSVTCPNCAKVLRLSARPAHGKKIKCPACEEAFVPELDDEESGIQSKPGKSRPPANKRSRAEEDDDDIEDGRGVELIEAVAEDVEQVAHVRDLQRMIACRQREDGLLRV